MGKQKGEIMIELRVLAESMVFCLLVNLGLVLITGFLTFGFGDFEWFFNYLRFPPAWMAFICCIVIVYLMRAS